MNFSNISYVFISFSGIPITTVEIVSFCFTFVVGLAAVILNIQVLLALFEKRLSLQDNSLLFIVNLAVTDFIVGLLVIYQAFYVLLQWRNFYECLLRYGFFLSLNMASGLNIAVLSVDRFIKIKYPLQYPRMVTTRRVLGIVGFIWCVNILMSFAPFSGWHQDVSGREKNFCTFFEIFVDSYFTVVIFIFFIPFVVIIIVYSQIAVLARQHALAIRAQTCQQQPQRKSVWKIAKTVMYIVLAYFLCWMPSGCLLLAVVLDRKNLEARGVPVSQITSYVVAVGVLNSVLNPLIYASKVPCISAFFRRQRFWRCCLCLKNNTVEAEGTLGI